MPGRGFRRKTTGMGLPTMSNWAKKYGKDLYNRYRGQAPKYDISEIRLWCKRYHNELNGWIRSGEKCPEFMDRKTWTVYLLDMRLGFADAYHALGDRNFKAAVLALDTVVEAQAAGYMAYQRAKRVAFEQEYKEAMQELKGEIEPDDFR